MRSIPKPSCKRRRTRVRGWKRSARQLQAQIEELTGQIAREEEQLQAAEAHIAEMERDAALKKEALQKDGQQRQELAARLTEARIALNTVQKDLELYHERRAAAEQRKQELNFNIEQKQQNIQELLDANEDLAEDIAFKKQQIEELAEELEALQKTVADSEAERRAA